MAAMADTPSETIFIGDIPGDLDEEGIQRVFAAYGTIKSQKLLPVTTASGKRACIISFATVAEAMWIVENLQGNIPQGLTSPITVNYKRSSKGKGDVGCGKGDYGCGKGDFGYGKGGDWGYGGGCGGYGKGDMGGKGDYGKAMDKGGKGGAWGGPYSDGGYAAGDEGVCENLYIGELPPDIDEEKLQAVFAPYGTIKSHRLLESKGPGAKRAAIISFSRESEAKWIVDNLNGNIPQGLTEPVKCSYKRAKEKGGEKGAWGCEKGGWGCEKGGWSGGYPGGGYDSYDGYEGGFKGKGGYDSYDGKGFGAPGKGCGKGGGKSGIREILSFIQNSGALPGGSGYNEESALFVGGLPRDTTDYELYILFSVFGAIAPKGLKAMVADDGVSCKGFGFVNYLEPESARRASDTLNGTRLPDGTMLKVTPKKQQDKNGGKGKA